MSRSDHLLLAALLLCCGCADEAGIGGRSLAAILGESGDAGFERATEPRRFSFPDDHGAHPSFRSEWWYLTTVLRNAEGRTFGNQFTLFRQAYDASADVGDPWRSGQIYVGHLALSDVAGRRHIGYERLVRGHPQLARVRTRPFEATVETWSLSSTGEEFAPLRLTAVTGEFAVDLQFVETKPMVLHGDRGLSRKGPGNASYYYSIPRLEARGSLTIAGQVHEVTGTGWFDREWSTSVLNEAYAGWDWFAVHLQDGRDFVVYQLRRHDGSSAVAAGVAVASDGSAAVLGPDDVSMAPGRTFDGWPVQWTLDVAGQTYLVEAAFDRQVMDLGVRYWEGVVHVSSADGSPGGSGDGYMELTGY